MDIWVAKRAIAIAMSFRQLAWRCLSEMMTIVVVISC